jgi:hypothetical protein
LFEYLQIYLALGLVALLWLMLKVNVARILTLEIFKLTVDVDEGRGFLSVLWYVLRMLISLCIYAIVVVLAWPGFLAMYFQGAAHNHS